jgi:hypothetical protein
MLFFMFDELTVVKKWVCQTLTLTIFYTCNTCSKGIFFINMWCNELCRYEAHRTSENVKFFIRQTHCYQKWFYQTLILIFVFILKILKMWNIAFNEFTLAKGEFVKLLLQLFFILATEVFFIILWCNKLRRYWFHRISKNIRFYIWQTLCCQKRVCQTLSLFC